jgi:hypothetical protein
METGMEVGAISEAHPNVGAHGGVGQQGSTLPFLSIGTGSMVIDKALLTRTDQYLSSFVAVPLDMSLCEYFKLSKY